jgi:hypothetical protein
MSFLSSALRIHFSGDFVAAPSTVNNDLDHFDNSTFDPVFQTPQTATALNGWWNPRGDHAFKINAMFRSGFLADGSAVPSSDVGLSTSLLTVNTPPGVMVDLDPQQQLVSTLYGVRILVPNPGGGAPYLRANLATVSFTDIWRRGLSGGGDEAACAAYQSVLESIVWGDVSGSPLLSALKAAATDNLLSIKFNVDGYHMDSTNLRFTMGRIVGTLGVAGVDEPKHFVRGRHLDVPEWQPFFPGGPIPTSPYPGARPVRGLQAAVAIVDHAMGKVRIDLGNSIPVNPAGGSVANVGAIEVVCDAASASPLNLGSVNYSVPNWYEMTAGIVELPEERSLTAAELALIDSKPLTIRRSAVDALVENPDGFHVRADDMVFRLNPGDDMAVTLWTSKFGVPLSGATIDASLGVLLDNTNTGTPASALSFPSTITSNAHGIATLPLHSSDPGNPRGFIDGQVYRVDYRIHGERQGNLSDFLSVLVWNGFTPETPPTWLGSMKPILTQYANLYPIMDTFFNMADYEDVSANRGIIVNRLQRPDSDARYMPISRDLSRAKRDSMIAWLLNVGADGKPLFAPPPPPTPFESLPGKAELAIRRLNDKSSPNH